MHNTHAGDALIPLSTLGDKTTGAEKPVEVQEAWIKKLNVMKCCKGKTSLPDPLHITKKKTTKQTNKKTLPKYAHTHKHGVCIVNFCTFPPYSPLPQPAFPPPLTLSSSSFPLDLLLPHCRSTRLAAPPPVPSPHVSFPPQVATVFMSR